MGGSSGVRQRRAVAPHSKSAGSIREASIRRFRQRTSAPSSISCRRRRRHRLSYRSHAIFFFDYDEDGDTDLFIGNGGQTPDQRGPTACSETTAPTGMAGWTWCSRAPAATRRGGCPDPGVRCAHDQATWSHSWHVTRGSGFSVGQAGASRIGTGLHEGGVGHCAVARRHRRRGRRRLPSTTVTVPSPSEASAVTPAGTRCAAS